MKRARPGERPDKQQPRFAKKHEHPADRPAVSDEALDVMSADSFPASDPPSFAAMRVGRRNAVK